MFYMSPMHPDKHKSMKIGHHCVALNFRMICTGSTHSKFTGLFKGRRCCHSQGKQAGNDTPKQKANPVDFIHFCHWCLTCIPEIPYS